MLTLGSLFDGIGGWLLAASHNNIKPVWSSEIDPYPAAVSHCHFPTVTQHGDITKISGFELEPVDIICAGSPCQDLSVAGKRSGLAGERSGLFMDAVRITREMQKKTNGMFPKYFVWENVAGAFSSNGGNDFKAVLEEIAGISIPMPESGKWARAGMVRSNGCNVEWRTLDAQHWGVPQRRTRIFLVASFGRDKNYPILFEDSIPTEESSIKQRDEKKPPPFPASVSKQVGDDIPHLASGRSVVGCLAANCGTKLWLGNQEAFGGNYHIICGDTIRRLTPLECERLQGLPDSYTNVEFEDKPSSPDTRRYKAVGNGMAQPCADFVIRRICQKENGDKK